MTGLSLSEPALVDDAPAGARTRVDLRRLALPLVLVLAFVSSATSLSNGFAYDDNWIIATNARVHSLAEWWRFFGQSYWPPTYNEALYRPLTILAFAIEWAIGGGKPWPFHVANVVLYAVACGMFYRFARLFLPRLASWIVASLFAVHPVHVEAVGNSVGQAELWVAIVFFGAMSLYVRWRREGPLGWPRTLALAGLYLVGCLFKEHGVVLVALLASLELTVLAGDRPLRERMAEVRPLYLLMVALALAFVFVRSQVLGGLAGDNPHPVWVDLDAGQRLLTVVGVLVPEWARLLAWPARLVADYSPLDVPVYREWSLGILPGVAILAGVLLLFAVAWRRAPVAAAGFLLLAVTLAPVSNVFFGSGVMIAERTLFLPSAGFLLAVGTLVPHAEAHVRRTRLLSILAAGTLALVLAAGAARSAERQRTWSSTTEVFLNMAADAPLNFRARYGWGGELFNRQLHAQGEREFRLAIKLYPFYHGVRYDLAERYQKNGMHAAAVPLFQEVVAAAPDRADARSMLVHSLLQLGRYEEARDEAIRGVRWGNSTNVFRVLLARAYRGLGGDAGVPSRVHDGVSGSAAGAAVPLPVRRGRPIAGTRAVVELPDTTRR